MSKSNVRYPLWELMTPPSTWARRDTWPVRALGTQLWFNDGRAAIDANSGLWNVNLGYVHPKITEAIVVTLNKAPYLTLFRQGHPYAESAAEALVRTCGSERFGRVLFSTSGSAANDMMLKLVRRAAALRGEPERQVVVGLRGGYHGLTYGSHALTGQDLGQDLYHIDRRLTRHVTHQDPGELRALFAAEGAAVAAVVVEPVIGSGAFPLPVDFLAALFELRAQYGFLLVADEVATGFGRTGPMFAHHAWAEPPDMIVTSKGLTNGTCGASAVVVPHSICDLFDAADVEFVHGETHAAAPTSCSAILATLAAIKDEDLLTNGTRQGETLGRGLAEVASESPHVTEMTGIGLCRALHLRGVEGELLNLPRLRGVMEAVRQAGAVVSPGPSSIQIAPPLTCNDADIEQIVEAVRRGIKSVGLAESHPRQPSERTAHASAE